MTFAKYPKMKDSGIEWIGEIPEEWILKKLKFSVLHRTQKSTSNSQLPYVGLENVDDLIQDLFKSFKLH